MYAYDLLNKLTGHYGQNCSISVNNGDVYNGTYFGAEGLNQETPLVVNLKISKSEAARIGVHNMEMISIPYDVIDEIKF